MAAAPGDETLWVRNFLEFQTRAGDLEMQYLGLQTFLETTNGILSEIRQDDRIHRLDAQMEIAINYIPNADVKTAKETAHSARGPPNGTHRHQEPQNPNDRTTTACTSANDRCLQPTSFCVWIRNGITECSSRPMKYLARTFLACAQCACFSSDPWTTWSRRPSAGSTRIQHISVIHPGVNSLKSKRRERLPQPIAFSPPLGAANHVEPTGQPIDSIPIETCDSQTWKIHQRFQYRQS